jgi:acyl-CoA thioesterase I
MKLRLLPLALLFLFCSPSFAKTATLLALGDSLTEGYGISKEKSYPSVLEKLLKDKKIDVKVTNGGISGSTSASAVSRFKWYLKNKPDVLLLALGANDGLRGLPVGSMQSHLEKVIVMARENKIPVILAGMKIPLNYGAPYRSAYEKVFSDLAKKYSLIFVPFLLEGVGGVPTLNQADGIHPNEKGHEKVAQLLLPYVEKALRSH